jgi:hypothetical protein
VQLTYSRALVREKERQLRPGAAVVPVVELSKAWALALQPQREEVGLEQVRPLPREAAPVLESAPQAALQLALVGPAEFARSAAREAATSGTERVAPVVSARVASAGAGWRPA